MMNLSPESPEKEHRAVSFQATGCKPRGEQKAYSDVIRQHLIGDAVVTEDVIVDRRAGNNGTSQEAEESANG